MPHDTLKPLGGSLLEKAVNYVSNHRDLLENYLLDGRCEISNNTERLRNPTEQAGKTFCSMTRWPEQEQAQSSTVQDLRYWVQDGIYG